VNTKSSKHSVSKEINIDSIRACLNRLARFDEAPKLKVGLRLRVEDRWLHAFAADPDTLTVSGTLAEPNGALRFSGVGYFKIVLDDMTDEWFIERAGSMPVRYRLLSAELIEMPSRGGRR
jgi:hypothetical protein